MVIGITGESCAGKSTLAKRIAPALSARIITGKDYLRLARSETQAKALFSEMLASAAESDNVIYVISDAEQLGLLPDGAVRIYVRAELDVIKTRFAARLGGTLPPAVEKMLERRHGTFDGESCDYIIDGTDTGEAADALIASLTGRI